MNIDMQKNKLTLYPNVIKDILVNCLKYKLDMINLYDLKNSIWTGARNISAVEDYNVSDQLINTEGNLDYIQVTYEEQKKQKEEALKIITQLEEKCYSWIEII